MHACAMRSVLNYTLRRRMGYKTHPWKGKGRSMRLQITTDYAIRIMLFVIQQDGKVVPASRIAENLGVTYSCFNKVAYKLKNAGYLESIRGPSGGYFVTKQARDITLYDVVQTMEGDICINRCLEDDGFCSQNATATCPVHKALEEFQCQMIHTLKSKKIRDLCSRNEPDLLSEVTTSRA